MTDIATSTVEDPMSTLCRMVLETSYENLPAEVLEHAKHTLLDAIAVTIGGSGMEGIPEIVELVKEKGGAEQSLLPFYGGRVPAAEAALAIGPMPRAMDCGDLHEEAGHVSEYVVASLLAATGLRPQVTGEEFLTALVVGQEVMIRIGSAYRVIGGAIQAHDCGGHYIFGAVAAVGRLIGLNQDELENAQGIARTMTQPHTMGIYAPATLMVRVHHGLVCQAAITACLLARKGITGPRQSVLTGPNGYLASARWETNPNAILDDLGKRWEMSRITVKGYSACYFSHSSIDAIIDQMRTYGFGPADVDTIRIEVSTPAWRAVCEPVDEKWDPRTVHECQFSLPYAVATAAIDGTVFVDSYSEAKRTNPQARALMRRVSAVEVADVPDWGTRLTTTLRDGRVLTTEQAQVKGHPDNPFTEDDIVAKLRRCIPYSAHPLNKATVDGLIDAVLHLDDSRDVEADLLHPLSPSSP